MKVVVFDIWGDYGHFRRFFTTVSPLTFSFPPPTAVRGIIGAIIGASKKDYLRVTSGLKVGIQVLNPVKRVRIGQNFIHTKMVGGSFDPTLIVDRKEVGEVHTQVKVEYLKNPAFRLYIGGQDSVLISKIGELLKKHQTYYTISLGLSELLADFAYVGTYHAERLSEGEYEVHSVFPVDILADLRGLRPAPGLQLLKELVPIYMTPDREPLLYQEVIVEKSGRSIKIIAQEGLYRLDNGFVVYLW